MKRKLPSITSKLWSISTTLSIPTLWQPPVPPGLVEGFMLPSPVQVVGAFMRESPFLMENARIILAEVGLGPALGIAAGFGVAALMDWPDKAHKAFYPIIILTQTVSVVVIAPLPVLWFGYEVTPKVILIVITTSFPITVGMLSGFKAADPGAVSLLRAMGAGRLQIFRYIKLPGVMGQFFSSLRISVPYAVVGAVISEWLGGFGGLSVYMTRVKKAFFFDKMFVVIFLISVISSILMWAVELLQKKCMPWENSREHKQDGKTISGAHKRRD